MKTKKPMIYKRINFGNDRMKLLIREFIYCSIEPVTFNEIYKYLQRCSKYGQLKLVRGEVLYFMRKLLATGTIQKFRYEDIWLYAKTGFNLQEYINSF